jgi:hypothetical protein
MDVNEPECDGNHSSTRINNAWKDVVDERSVGFLSVGDQ